MLEILSFFPLMIDTANYDLYNKVTFGFLLQQQKKCSEFNTLQDKKRRYLLLFYSAIGLKNANVSRTYHLKLRL